MLSNLKIIFFLGNFELGGAERQAILLARYLREQAGADVQVWALGPPGRTSELCDGYNLPWRGIPFDYNDNFIGTAQRMLGLARLLRKASPDVIIPYTWFPNVLCGLLWRFVGSRVCIWNQRDSGISLDPARAAHRLAVKLTPFFISNSTHAATFLIDRFRVDQQRLAVIPNGVRLDPPRNTRIAWRERLGAEENDFVGCMVANFSKLKDHATAVRAWRVVVDQLAICRQRAMLVLAGRDDGTVNSISELIRELDLGRSVCILDSVDDVAGLLASSDIGVHCSEHEGCPNSVLEEMAAGLPVVASDNSGVRMALGERSEAFLARYQDSEGIAQRILEFVMDSNYRAIVGKNNRQRILKHYSVETMCRETTVFIENALKARNARMWTLDK